MVNQQRNFNSAMLAKESLTLWHKRLGHINVQRLKAIRDGMATGLKFSDEELSQFHCDACQLGKAHREPIYHKPVERSTVSGQKTHWDTCGLMPVSFVAGPTRIFTVPVSGIR